MGTSSLRNGTEWWNCPSRDILSLLSSRSNLRNPSPGDYKLDWSLANIIAICSAFIIQHII